MSKKNFVQQLLKRILIIDTSHPFIIIGIAVFLSTVSIVYTINNLDFYTDQRDLISPENRLIKLSEDIDQFDKLDNFIVAVENREDTRSIKFLNTLARRLKKDKDKYEEIFYRIYPDDFKQWALLYLKKDKLLEIKNNLAEHHDFIQAIASSPDLVSLFRQINREMSSKMIGNLFTGFLDENDSGNLKNKPMNLDFLVNILKELSRWLKFKKTPFRSPWSDIITETPDNTDGYLWNNGKKYLLMFVTPERLADSFITTEHSLVALRRAIDLTKRDFPGVHVGVTGQEAMNMDEMSVALHDMSIATVMSLTSLILLLTLFWRGIRRPLIEITELIVALCITTGLTTLFIGHLNILSITFAPLLLGLGIDYGIHWLARYQEEERVHHYPKGRAIRSAMTKMGPGIMLAGLTAALSFSPLIITGFRGLVELGIITAIGMVMTTITTLVLLPALVMVFDKSRHKQQEKTSPIDTEIRVLFTLNSRRSHIILGVGLVCAILSVWGGMGVKFDLNMLHLQSKNAESVKWEKKLLSDSKRSSMYGAMIAKSLGEVKRETNALERLDTVSEVQSVLTLIPENQEEKIQILKEIKPLVSDINMKTRTHRAVNIQELKKILHKIRFKMMDTEASNRGIKSSLKKQMTQVKYLIDEICSNLSTVNRQRLLPVITRFQTALFSDLDKKLDTLKQDIKDIRPMRPSDLPGTLKRRFISKKGHYLIRIFPNGDIWEPSFLKKFVHDLRTVNPDVIGDPVTLYVFTRAFKDACMKAAMYAVICIFLILLITSRNLKETLLEIVPLVLGTTWTLGLMRLFNVNLNLANSLFLPLIVGAGVEYGIIIIQRWRQMDNTEKNLALPFSTAKGIILAGLTTTVGFGSLIISDHQGIRSLGLLAVVGSLCILAAAVLFLPAVLQQHNVQKLGKKASTQ